MLIYSDSEGESAMVGSHQLLKEPFRRGNITLGAEHELDCLPGGVNGAIQVLPLRADLHIGFINAVRSAAHLQMRAHPLIDLWGIALDPPKNSRMIYREPSFTHHLLQIAERELVSAIPADA